VATVPHIHQPTNIVVAVTDFLLAFQLVEFGVGACIAPPLGPWQPPEKYTLFNIDHIFPIGTLGLIVRQASYISPQAQAFIDFLTERYVERPG
jgi:DNA-binding transcriptional LysR family regulator